MKNPLTFTVNVFSEVSEKTVKSAINECNPCAGLPIIVCIGSDLVLGDSLGPLVGTFLKQNGAGAYIYGTLNAPITAKEVEYAKVYLKKLHPNSKIIAIDAGIGGADDVGLIKINNVGLKPGLGVNKNLSTIGDMSIVGVVASKSVQNVNLFNFTRLNLVYRMAKVIAGGIMEYLKDYEMTLNKKSVC